jgi:uncharacterized protein YlzI (FlbEa/FlbD family)
LDARLTTLLCKGKNIVVKSKAVNAMQKLLRMRVKIGCFADDGDNDELINEM